MRSVGRVLISLVYLGLEQVDKPLKSLTHGQCDAKPTVTFPVAGQHCPATGTKLYCLVAEAHVCEQLAQSRYIPDSETAGSGTRDLSISRKPTS